MSLCEISNFYQQHLRCSSCICSYLLQILAKWSSSVFVLQTSLPSGVKSIFVLLSLPLFFSCLPFPPCPRSCWQWIVAWWLPGKSLDSQDLCPPTECPVLVTTTHLAGSAGLKTAHLLLVGACCSTISCPCVLYIHSQCKDLLCIRNTNRDTCIIFWIYSPRFLPESIINKPKSDG